MTQLRSRPANRMLIFEGCDRTGKTSAANILHSGAGWRTVKFGQPDPTSWPWEVYDKALCDAFMTGSRTVFDRLWVGENIYGPIFRGHGLHRAETVLLAARCLQLQALHVFFDASTQQIVDRMKANPAGETFINIANVNAIRAKYHKFFRGSDETFGARVPHFSVITSVSTPGEVAEMFQAMGWLVKDDEPSDPILVESERKWRLRVMNEIERGSIGFVGDFNLPYCLRTPECKAITEHYMKVYHERGMDVTRLLYLPNTDHRHD